jgi:hypothetical protein
VLPKVIISHKIELCRISSAEFISMLSRIETNVFFDEALYLVLFASNAGGV